MLCNQQHCIGVTPKKALSKSSSIYARRMPYLGNEEILHDRNRLRNVLKAYIYLLTSI